ncbi:lipocalin family protein [Chryseobacterium sp.]|uniref:lipocalin family protein n=1 Tax=Chryseobacterium sp. TaxID=1871047 RepID=UPI0025BF22BF|nr:lipocalin family protein [Chryseobacterium sp.]MBV8326162.1 hypothetical protein [Chryseobacterium sp.]
MKKRYLSLAVFSVIASCSNNNEPEPEPEIIGTWKHEKSTAYSSSLNETSTYVPTGCTTQDTYEFRQYDLITINHMITNTGCVPKASRITKYIYDPKTKKIMFNEEGTEQNAVVSVLNRINMVLEYHSDIDKDGIMDVSKSYLVRIK